MALRAVSDHLVVIFDEFQRLRNCPGDPLSIIRSALMSLGANDVSLVFTGSIRNALQMMLESSDQPIFGEAAEMQLPEIDRVDFLEYLDFQFEATGKPADEGALEHLLNATRAHPRSTQRLAWECWNDTAAGKPVTLEAVMQAHDRLVRTIERSEFTAVLDVLISGDEGEINEVRALQLIADRGGATVTSRPLVTRYGFSSHSRIPTALDPASAPGARRQTRRSLVHRRPAVQRVASAGLPACRSAGPRGACGLEVLLKQVAGWMYRGAGTNLARIAGTALGAGQRSPGALRGYCVTGVPASSAVAMIRFCSLEWAIG